jgi:riboflavin transporter FmnP
MKVMNTKKLAFALMMGALGNVLAVISYYAGPIAFGVALDFSLIAAFIAGFYGGPRVGFISGLFVGIFPGIMFGPMGMGGWLALIGLPVGKALSGLTAGLIAESLNLGQKPRSSLLAIPATLLAYVPECIYTYVYFAYLLPLFIGSGGAAIFIGIILPKAIGEVAIISVLMAALMGNKGFNDFVRTFFSTKRTTPRVTTAEK